MGFPRLVALTLAATAAPAACDRPRAVDAPAPDRPPSPPAAADAGLPAGEVVLRPLGRPETRVVVEFALTDAARMHGLMFRESLAPDAGMLFAFPAPPRRRSFWMRNTWIPLDMIFIDEGLQVVGVVERAEPLTLEPRAVAGDSLYVLEVNGGFAHEHGIGPGARIEILGLQGNPEPERP